MKKFFILLYLVLSLAACTAQKESESIFSAVQKGDLKSVERFISSGIDIDIQNADGETAAHIAAKNGSISILQYLLENGADINVKNNKGNTPLHIAAEKGKAAAVKLLVENGTDINAKNDEGNTPIACASLISGKAVIGKRRFIHT